MGHDNTLKTIKEAMEFLDVSRSTIYRLVDERRLTLVYVKKNNEKVPRLMLSELLRLQELRKERKMHQKLDEKEPFFNPSHKMLCIGFVIGALTAVFIQKLP